MGPDESHKTESRAGGERVGVFQPGKEKLLGRLYSKLSVCKGRAIRKIRTDFFYRACCDWIRGDSLKLKERIRLGIRKWW